MSLQYSIVGLKVEGHVIFVACPDGFKPNVYLRFLYFWRHNIETKTFNRRHPVRVDTSVLPVASAVTIDLLVQNSCRKFGGPSDQCLVNTDPAGCLCSCMPLSRRST